jgi:hypothetical protein
MKRKEDQKKKKKRFEIREAISHLSACRREESKGRVRRQPRRISNTVPTYVVQQTVEPTLRYCTVRLQQDAKVEPVLAVFKSNTEAPEAVGLEANR